MSIVIALIVVFAAAALIIRFSKPQKECCEHSPVEETQAPIVEESQPEVETVATVEVVPTTPPSAPTMAAKKKKKPQPKKKPAKANA